MPDLKDRLQRTLGSNYTLERELGGGGMSRVFVAQEVSLGRRVVVKVLLPDLAATVNIERFRREIQLAAKLQHPHIVPVLTAGISDGLPYYIMPFIEGESLRARLDRSGELPVREAEKISRDVLSALSYAHEHGVVHRDIKPENILLTAHHAVVTDFGVAKAFSAATNPGSSLTSPGVVLGTPAYMSPEQAAADPTMDHRADLYSVGTIAYEMLTGHMVFGSRSQQAMFAAHAIEQPEPIDRFRPSVPVALCSLIMRSLEKHAADRPQSADEMLAELEEAIGSGGATPYRAGARKPGMSVKSERRGLLIAVASALVLLTIASSSWYWYDHKARADPAVADTTPSLAVLPFENLGTSDDAYFAEGMTDEISSRLGALPGLRLIGRHSAKSYANTSKPVAQVGKELGVAYLLTGTVRWDRSRAGRSLVKISPALLRASDGAQVWSEPYQGEAKNVFEIQGKVAERVAQALEVRLTERQQETLTSRATDNLEAYDAYLRGKALSGTSYDPTQYARAISLLKRAIALDPEFAEAYALLARAHLLVYWFRGDPSPQRLELAKAAIDRGLAIDPKLSIIQIALAEYYYHGKLDYVRALDAISTAQRLAPNDPTALNLKGRVERRQSRWADAISDMKRASELDPLNGDFFNDVCESQIWVGSYVEAQKACARLKAVAPERVLGYYFLSRLAVLRSGDVKAALAVLEEAKTQLGPQELIRGLTAEETRSMIWPAILNPELGRSMRSAQPLEGVARIGYFTSMLMLAVYQKNPPIVRQFADSIIFYGPRSLRGNFHDSETYAHLALAYGAKGDREKSLEATERAMAMVPVKADAIRAAGNMFLGARGAVLAGANAEAIEALRRLLRIPSEVNANWLRLDPWFDPLRQDPRFKQLVSVP